MESRGIIKILIDAYSDQLSRYQKLIDDLLSKYQKGERFSNINKLRGRLFFVVMACSSARSMYSDGFYDGANSDLESAEFHLGLFREDLKIWSPEDYQEIFGQSNDYHIIFEWRIAPILEKNRAEIERRRAMLQKR